MSGLWTGPYLSSAAESGQRSIFSGAIGVYGYPPDKAPARDGAYQTELVGVVGWCGFIGMGGGGLVTGICHYSSNALFLIYRDAGPKPPQVPAATADPM